MRLAWCVLAGAGGLLAITGGASTAHAQQAAGCPTATAPALSRTAVPSLPGARAADSAAFGTDVAAARTAADADVVLLASVAARTVHFRSEPRVRVRLCWGDGGGDSLRVIERRNLPRPVAAGTTYRDVYVAVELLGHLNAVCLLRELGLSRSVSADSVAKGAPAPAACGPAPLR